MESPFWICVNYEFNQSHFFISCATSLTHKWKDSMFTKYEAQRMVFFWTMDIIAGKAKKTECNQIYIYNTNIGPNTYEGLKYVWIIYRFCAHVCWPSLTLFIKVWHLMLVFLKIQEKPSETSSFLEHLSNVYV